MIARYLLVTACLGLTAIPSQAGEPIAQGKPLSYWLLLLREGELQADPAGPWESEVGPGPSRTSLALKAPGSEGRTAVPALLTWFHEGSEGPDAHRIKAEYLLAALRDIGCTDGSLAPLLQGLALLEQKQPDATARSISQDPEAARKAGIP
jgi:hypothetical protein